MWTKNDTWGIIALAIYVIGSLSVAYWIEYDNLVAAGGIDIPTWFRGLL